MTEENLEQSDFETNDANENKEVEHEENAEGDWSLQMFAYFAKFGMETPVTIVTNGIMISGFITSNRKFLESQIKQMRRGLQGARGDKDAYAETLKSLVEETYIAPLESEISGKIDPRTFTPAIAIKTLFLRSPQIISSSGKTPLGTYYEDDGDIILKLKLNNIDGYFYGS